MILEQRDLKDPSHTAFAGPYPSWAQSVGSCPNAAVVRRALLHAAGSALEDDVGKEAHRQRANDGHEWITQSPSALPRQGLAR